MAARNLPVPDALTRTISIGANFATSPQGIVVGSGDTVNFANSSGSDITIAFLANTPGAPVYPNMNLIVPNGTTAGFTVPTVDCAANYNIMVNGIVQNVWPYVIQVGTGPMFVLVTASGGTANFNPGTLAVPLGNAASGMGMLQMKSNLPNNVPIYWGTDPFSPGITQPGPPQPIKGGTLPGEYDYSTTQSPKERAGGGKVIIQN
jgi:hypothetical protein